MFVAAADRDRVRERLLDLAQADPGIPAAAVTGSLAAGAGDRWSDLDLALAVRGSLAGALARWTGLLYGEFGALHHWDLPSGTSVYRVFLLPGGLEVDLGFSPEEEFGPRGPNWLTCFGAPATGLRPVAPPDRDELAGRGWHHVLHARASIGRRRYWQAEYWISAVRDQVVALACLRLGCPPFHAKGAHLLPAPVTAPLEAALVRSLDEPELHRALAAATAALLAELKRSDPSLTARLRPVLTDPGSPGG
jgi:hypothetical protein